LYYQNKKQKYAKQNKNLLAEYQLYPFFTILRNDHLNFKEGRCFFVFFKFLLPNFIDKDKPI
jgi:hypothetical protein